MVTLSMATLLIIQQLPKDDEFSDRKYFPSHDQLIQLLLMI